MLMTDELWKKSTHLRGRRRSLEMLTIGFALAKYNASQAQPPAKRINLLQDIKSKISAWNGGGGARKRKRAEAVKLLGKRVDKEIDTLDSVSNPRSPDQVLMAVNDLYNRGVHQLHALLAKKKDPKITGDDQVKDLWGPMRAAAKKIENNAASLNDRNAQDSAMALPEGMRAFDSISHLYFAVAPKAGPKTDLGLIDSRLANLAGGAQTKDAKDFIAKVPKDITRYKAIGVPAQADEGGSAVMDFDFDLIEQALDTNDIGSTMEGYLGTGGKGNEGYEEFTKSGDDKWGR